MVIYDIAQLKKGYKLVENKSKFTFMPHIITKFTKCMIRTIFLLKSGYRTMIFFLQLWSTTIFENWNLSLNCLNFDIHPKTMV